MNLQATEQPTLLHMMHATTEAVPHNRAKADAKEAAHHDAAPEDAAKEAAHHDAY